MRWNGVIVSVAVAAGFYLTLFAGSGFGETVAAAGRLGPGWWLMILGLSLVNYVLRYLRWDAYLRLAGHRLPALRHLIVYVAGFALTTTPAKAGEAVRAIYLKPLGVGIRRTVATLYAERVVDVISIALLAMLLYRLPGGGYRWLAAVAGGGVLALLLLRHRFFLRAAAGLAFRFPGRRLRRFALHAVGCLRQAGPLLRGRWLTFGVLIGLASWGAEALAFHLVLQELGIPVGLAGAVGIYATAILAGALSFVPGGLGGTEAVMAALLLFTGAAPPEAMAATAIIRVATLWFAVALGVVALPALELAGRRATKSAPDGAVPALGGGRSKP
ncbi:MAG TPA: lysylphosphatidylglycerol synthase transmembrane domain-containing protein [Pseudomonadales bacterium]